MVSKKEGVKGFDRVVGIGRHKDCKAPREQSRSNGPNPPPAIALDPGRFRQDCLSLWV